MRTALYPGTFDPVTYGHLSILSRALKIFDRIVVGIAASPQKATLFSTEERLQLMLPHLPEGKRSEAMTYDCLTVDLARQLGAVAVIRGLRAVSDFEYEFQLNHMNREFEPEIETIFFMPNEIFFFTSSGLIKQLARYTEDIGKFVPPNVCEALKQRYRDQA